MDDSSQNEARTPHLHRFVTELEMLAHLNQALWEVERQRAEEANDNGTPKRT